jgi:hypothetical protein
MTCDGRESGENIRARQRHPVQKFHTYAAARLARTFSSRLRVYDTPTLCRCLAAHRHFPPPGPAGQPVPSALRCAHQPGNHTASSSLLFVSLSSLISKLSLLSLANLASRLPLARPRPTLN